MLGHKCVREAEEKGTPRDHFILTYTGKVFWFDEIRPEAIDIRDIAHALSHICRYTGQVNMFFSVAQHSLLVAEKMPGGPAKKLVALLHDAAEAYMSDLSSPLKKWLEHEGSLAYSTTQDKITAAIYNKFGVTDIPSDVRLYDLAACVFEAEGFMGRSPGELQAYGFPMEVQGLWQPWDPRGFAGTNSDREFWEVETEFLRRFEALMHACGRGELV